MEVIETVQALQMLIQEQRAAKKSIGFIPTMGALHAGHLALVNTSCRQNHCNVVSIFVNPTQFNDKEDLKKYPKTLENDLLLLKTTKVDYVFAPDAEAIYPNGADVDANLDLGGLDASMEGRFRPGHFKGMAQVVKRLLDIVRPDQLYMGQKDFQQFTIVKHMIQSLQIPTKLVVCPIVREKTGLAMSSRNTRLSPSSRERSGSIYQTLRMIKRYRNQKEVSKLIDYGIKRLQALHYNVEYLEIVDGYTLKPITDLSQSKYAVACVAVVIDGVRLIDNIILQKHEK